MSTVRFSLVYKKTNGKNNMDAPAPVRIRISKGKGKQYGCNLPIKIFPSAWNAKKQEVSVAKNSRLYTMAEANAYSRSLDELKLRLLKEEDRIALEKTGEVVDDHWLRRIVDDFFDVTKKKSNDDDSDRERYLTDYMDFWVQNRMETHVSRGKKTGLSQSSKQQYRSFVNKVKDFEADTGKRIEFRRLDDRMQGEIVLYFKNVKKWRNTSMALNLAKFKFFVKRASRDNIKIHDNFPGDSFSAATAKPMTYVTFNMEEINHIFNFDFSHDPELDAVRDWFIIGLNSGMAFSDLRTLDFKKHFTENLTIKKARLKTGVEFVVPPFHQITETITKYNGLPPMKVTKSKVNDNKAFNEKLQAICRIMGFTELTDFPVYHYSWEQGKKINARAPKWMAVTSHCVRRSFATNMSRKEADGKQIMDNSRIMTAAGWSDEKYLHIYNQMSNDEKMEGAETNINEMQKAMAELSRLKKKLAEDERKLDPKVIHMNAIGRTDEPITNIK